MILTIDRTTKPRSSEISSKARALAAGLLRDELLCTCGHSPGAHRYRTLVCREWSCRAYERVSAPTKEATPATEDCIA